MARTAGNAAHLMRRFDYCLTGCSTCSQPCQLASSDSFSQTSRMTPWRIQRATPPKTCAGANFRGKGRLNDWHELAHAKGERTDADSSRAWEAAATWRTAWLFRLGACGTFRCAGPLDSWLVLCGSLAAGRRLKPEREARPMTDILAVHSARRSVHAQSPEAGPPVAPHVQIGCQSPSGQGLQASCMYTEACICLLSRSSEDAGCLKCAVVLGHGTGGGLESALGTFDAYAGLCRLRTPTQVQVAPVVLSAPGCDAHKSLIYRQVLRTLGMQGLAAALSRKVAVGEGCGLQNSSATR